MKRNARQKKRMISLIVAMLLLTTGASASNISQSSIGTGVKEFFVDMSSYLVIIAPIVGGVAAVYFTIRKAMADDQDGKMWQHRIVVAILCGVGAAIVSGVIGLVSSYF